MGRRAGRPPEQTRRLLLDAAAVVVRTRGLGATLDEVARAAGVSKGGLMYHFASKDALIQALATDLVEEFRQEVRAALAPEDRAPGRLTRAYLRACFDPTVDEHTLRDTLTLTAQLMTSPEVEALLRADTERWNDELRADGLPEDVLALVVAAADGVSLPFFGGGPGTPQARRLLDQLLALTHDPSPWERVARSVPPGDRTD